MVYTVGYMTTLYRTYRPSQFDQVIGQDQAVTELKKLLASGNVPHSLIFVGGRGIGKTTLARIVASELGTDPTDIYELDAASNRGVDDIRELRENVMTLPMRSKFKVYILDEVHMLTSQAWNAFLKTLEEPPEHIKFLMATTEVHQIPDTIISRSRVIRLQSPTVESIASYVAGVAKQESVSLSPDVCEVIAVSANGSFRDALVSLESVIASGYTNSADVSRHLGVPELASVRGWLRALHDSDVAAALTIITDMAKKDIDVTSFLELALVRVRMALSQRVGIEQTITSPDDRELIESLTDARPVTSNYLIAIVEALRMAKSVPVPGVVLEIVTYKLTQPL